MKFLNISQTFNGIISTTSDWIFIIYDTLELRYQAASDRTIFISLALMDKELLAKLSKQ